MSIRTITKHVQDPAKRKRLISLKHRINYYSRKLKADGYKSTKAAHKALHNYETAVTNFTEEVRSHV